MTQRLSVDSNATFVRRLGKSLAELGGTSQGKTCPQNMYANMILSQWEMSYATRTLTDDHLSLLAAEFLSGTIGREFWVIARQARLDTSESKLNRRFHEIIDEEYQRLLTNPAIPPPEPGAPSHGGDHHHWGPLALGAAIVGLGVVIRLIQRGQKP